MKMVAARQEFTRQPFLCAVVGALAGHDRFEDAAQGFGTEHPVGNHHGRKASSLRGYSRVTTITGPMGAVLDGRPRIPYFLACGSRSSAADAVSVVTTTKVS